MRSALPPRDFIGRRSELEALERRYAGRRAALAPCDAGRRIGSGSCTGNGGAALSWTASARATSYKVKRASVSGGPYTVIATVTTTTYTNTGLVDENTYYYVVSAVNTAGESPNSNQATVRIN